LSFEGRFANRRHAGQVLATELGRYVRDPRVVVLALPRGGVPVAHEVAKALGAPLDVFVVRKLGVPGHEELAMGALASGGVRVVSRDTMEAFGISEKALNAVTAAEQRELERREEEYRGDRGPLELTGRIVVLIDDGLATGATMSAAVRGIRQLAPVRIVVAVPVAAPETCAALSHEVDDMVCAVTPERFVAVGLWYDDFSQTTDEEVRDLLHDGRAAASAAPRAPEPVVKQ
jgi:predicted phosphoribosyltransferase